ncbi:triose-phosphate isomerase [bacterium]|nr:triose-phosphate isomerase [bacterium]
MQKLICANWKMNKNKKDALLLIKVIDNKAKGNVVVFPTFAYLDLAKSNSKNIKIGAQNCATELAGAFTGEVSAKQIKDYATFVLVGHSERRRYQKETDKDIAKKIMNALSVGLKVIFCVGEDLVNRKSKKTDKVLKTQIMSGLALVSDKDIRNIIIAYEPVWSLSTTKNRKDCSVNDARDASVLIKDIIFKKFNKNIKVLFGGNVNPENAQNYLSIKEYDGALVGGASLDAKKFISIIKQA